MRLYQLRYCDVLVCFLGFFFCTFHVCFFSFCSQLFANTVLFTSVNLSGLFVRILTERAQRKAFLQARNCIEERLRMEDENEKQVRGAGELPRAIAWFRPSSFSPPLPPTYPPTYSPFSSICLVQWVILTHGYLLDFIPSCLAHFSLLPTLPLW